MNTAARGRYRNDGLRKLCSCQRKRWSECPHSWFLNFKWKNQHYRFSIDKELSRQRGTPVHVDSKTEAEAIAEEFRTKIRAGEFRSGAASQSVRDTLTLAGLMESYRKQHLAVK